MGGPDLVNPSSSARLARTTKSDGGVGTASKSVGTQGCSQVPANAQDISLTYTERLESHSHWPHW